MNNPIVNDTAKTAQNLAQQIAKQMAQEPLEILKEARQQTTGGEFTGQPDNFLSNPFGGQADQIEQQKKNIEEQNEAADKMKSSRLMEALKREIADIHKQNVFKDLQDRINQGEEVPLEDYPELSMDYKQVLKAQMEAVKNRMLNAKYANQDSGPLFGSSKPDRRMGQKQTAQKEQTRTEKPVQNST